MRLKLTASQAFAVNAAQQQAQQAQAQLEGVVRGVLAEHGQPVTAPVQGIEDGHLIVLDPPEDDPKEE